MIVQRQADGVLQIQTVIEAKAGKSAARGLRRSASTLDEPEEFARFVIDQDRARVVRVLRRSGSEVDADAVARGSRAFSEDAVAVMAADTDLRRTVVQAELGGQVRKDIERLYPHIDEDVAAILIDGMPDLVRLSPTQTRFVGALPADVPSATIARDLGEQGISFAALPVSETVADVTALARRLVSVLDEATPAGP